MGFFGGGGGVKTPKVEPATPIPAAPQPVSETADNAIRETRRRSGFERAILTGTFEDTGKKKTTLG